MSVDNPPAAPAAQLTAIWLRFRDATLARVDLLDDTVIALLENRLGDDLRRNAEREAHKLAGSSGTFGFPRASTIARDLERLFASSTLSADDVVPISELLVQLRTDLEGSPQASPTPVADVAPANRPTLLIVEGEPAIAERITMEAEGRGFATIETSSIADARRVLATRRPDVAIIGLRAGESNADAFELLDELRAQSPPVPAIVSADTNCMQHRVEVARRGARRCIERPTPPRLLIDAVHSIWSDARGNGGTVLAVDDDPQILAALGALLPPQGLSLVTLQDPLGFWQQLEVTNPDLILLDFDMPSINGVELCRMVRNDPRWASVPIVFLTSRKDPQSIERAFAAGADDHLAKPIIATDLLLRVTNRLQRTRLQRKRAEIDPSTGIRNRERSAILIDRFVHLARRTMQPLSIAIVTLDAQPSVTGHEDPARRSEVLRALAGVLASAVRPEEIVGRWNGDEIIIAAYGSDAVELAGRVEAMLTTFGAHALDESSGQPFYATARAGIAAFPADGESCDALATAALGATHLLANGPELVRFARNPGGRYIYNTDVVIVDDDATLVALVEHGIRTRGLATRWFGDGESALESLAGPEPAVRARLLVLDVDLPGINGYDLLRRLVRDGATQRTQVIMVTARNAEGDILTGLEMGAIDHVSKPFSLPVLLQKITAALRARVE